MNYLFIENLGWALLHSIWQIAAAAFFLLAVLRLSSGASARFRYAVSVFILGLAFLLPVTTFIRLAGNSQNTHRAAEAFQTRDSFLREKISPPNERLQNIKDGEGAAAESNYHLILNSADLPSKMPWLVALWLLGVACFTLRLFGGVWQLHKFKTRQISEPEKFWREKFSAVCEKLEITQKVKLLSSKLVETPIVIGWLKPVILIPASVFFQIDPQELETIIAHELIHIRRRDYLVNFAQSLIEILFFYHPGVWWISAQIRREREFVCDDIVSLALEGKRVVYAQALANLEELRLLTNTQVPSIALAIGGTNGGNLMLRIQRILQKKTEIKRNPSAWSALLGFAFISALLVGIFSVNQVPLVNAQKTAKDKKLAIGFVSIPPVDRSGDPPKDADSTARLIIAKLTQHKVPAIGFVNGSMISDGEKLFPVRANIVRMWRDAGLEVGIGNYKHVWFYDTPYDEYVAGVEKTEQITSKLLAEKDLELHYFSYPYLNTGKSTEDKIRFEAWLRVRGMRSIPYTIDNSEWMYSYAYDMARMDNDISTMNEIRVDFIKYMDQMFGHFEAYSQEMFGRDIAQTMVLTPSRLVADSADDLFGMIERRGYKFVSMDEALKDEAYGTPENFVGKSGISWFERWTMAQKKRLRDEPKVSAQILKIWDERKPGK
ncbi:MAG TPA: M56 family metallopeptidase [Pyrinomonadaceae bacterium]|jgi:beta-lactamase regulating signal transducer with metallopeptidase domain|nr:M56 family metallopeptidase [Pyrinomonadaceae bacterium]